MIIRQAAGLIAGGGVVAFPTRCLYGLGTDAYNAAAVGRLFELKGRSPRKPILILIKRREWLTDLAAQVTETAARIMNRFWPGRVTLIFNAAPALPHQLTAGTATIGIRLTGHPVASALIDALGAPLTGTSANLSGHPGCRMIEELDPRLAGQLDAVLDAGMLESGIGSTVVDVTRDPPRVLREGAVSAREILDAVQETRR